MTFLLDDVRNIPADYVARTYKVGIMLYTKNYLNIDHLYLDNDLGSKKEGIDFLKYLEANKMLPKKVTIVSSNVVAVERMRHLLFNNQYSTIDNKTFYV